MASIESKGAVNHMDATKLLIADHNRVKGLFARYKKAHEAKNVKDSTALASKITEELRVHTTIEERVFYPAVREMSDTLADAVDEGVEEHHVVKILLDEIDALKPGSDEWTAKITVVIESVEHHVEEEEEEMFPKVRSNSTVARREELGEALEAQKVDLGAPTLADKADMTVQELSEKAKEQEIPGRSTMDHDELAATVAPD
jgi:hemerythrin superfamily protein